MVSSLTEMDRKFQAPPPQLVIDSPVLYAGIRISHFQTQACLNHINLSNLAVATTYNSFCDVIGLLIADEYKTN